MAIRYYDDAIVAKIQKWLPTTSKLRVLKPDESNRFYKLTADDNKDAKFKLPLIALSRSNDLPLISNIKQSKSFDGLKLHSDEAVTVHLNIIPVLPSYQLDIYTKTAEEGDEYIRNFLFKLINNPKIIIEIPYNDLKIKHVANIRILDTVSDTSNISEHLFPGQFTRWTIQMEVHDAFLFSIPYKNNWHFVLDNELEITDDLSTIGEIEPVEIVDKENNT